MGLHLGAPVQLTMVPALANTGVVFVRQHGSRAVEIPARPESVANTANAMTLERDGASVSTVEHLLAALRTLGVDNVRIEIDGPEVPVMDGSSASFAYLIRSAGLFVQPEPRSVIVMRKTLEYSDGLRSIRIEPCREFRVSYAVDFDHPAIGRQELHIPRLSPAYFEKEIAPARTFGFLHDVEALWKAGLARGGSLDNTVLLDAHRVLNGSGLRWPDEFVRHKILDLLGDLALLPHPVKGHVHVERGGHGLHMALMEQIRAHPRASKLVQISAAVWSYADRAYLVLGQDWRGWLDEGLLDLGVETVLRHAVGPDDPQQIGLAELAETEVSDLAFGFAFIIVRPFHTPKLAQARVESVQIGPLRARPATAALTADPEGPSCTHDLGQPMLPI